MGRGRGKIATQRTLHDRRTEANSVEDLLDPARANDFDFGDSQEQITDRRGCSTNASWITTNAICSIP
jgi:hypothetical protein